jgi:hypothetical protein
LFGLEAQARDHVDRNKEKSPELAEPLPDLIVSRIEVLTMTSTSLDYILVIKNIGDAAADIDGVDPGYSDNVNYQSILSPDNIYNNPGDRGAGGSVFLEPDQLAPGEEYSYTIPSAMSEVYYFDYDYLFVELDTAGNLTETNETNNVGMASLPLGPDLIVEDVTVLNINSDQIVYQFTVRNIGDGMADLDGPDAVDLYDNVNFRGVLSPDDIMDNAGDKPAGGSYLFPPSDPAELDPGEAFTKYYSAGMGGANHLDFHYLFVEIDGFENLGETNENNNIGMTEVPRFLYLPLIIR